MLVIVKLRAAIPYGKRVRRAPVFETLDRLTSVAMADYAFSMVGLRLDPCARVILVLGCITVPCSSHAAAAEFYSWIDPSGTMVMTDDPGRIPPAAERSRITIHRFRDVAPLTDQPHMNIRSSSRDQAGSEGESVFSRQSNTVASVDSAELPEVVLDTPEERLKPQYVWVPLSSPRLIASYAISGFWWHPGVMRARDAFEAFLRKQTQRIWHGQGHRWANSPSWNPVPRSGNAVYDQVLRERRALVQQTSPHEMPSPAASWPCCPAGRTGISSGRAAGR